jgi:uncharacterized protein YbjT (DUF2867 family)
MLRVNVGLSRKLSKDYNSNGFSVNIDGEVTAATNDAEAVMEQVKELFDLAEEALDLQIERAAGETAIASRDAATPVRTNSISAERPTTGNNATRNRTPAADGKTNGRIGSIQQDEPEPATNKQINYLLNIGKRQRLTTTQLEKRLAEILGRPIGLYDLTKQSAAQAIESLTSRTTTSNSASRN